MSHVKIGSCENLSKGRFPCLIVILYSPLFAVVVSDLGLGKVHVLIYTNTYMYAYYICIYYIIDRCRLRLPWKYSKLSTVQAVTYDLTKIVSQASNWGWLKVVQSLFRIRHHI